MIPSFDERGNLPPGIHEATWDEIVERYATNDRRRGLLKGLHEALESLRAASCRRAYLDGSFVSEKELPEDFDACWEVRGVDAALLDPEFLDFNNHRAAQKARYGGELFPAQLAAEPAGTIFSTTFNATATRGSPKGSSPSTLETGRDHERAPVPDRQRPAQAL